MQVAAKNVKVGDTITATYEGITSTLTVAEIDGPSPSMDGEWFDAKLVRVWFKTAEGGYFSPLLDDVVTVERVLPRTPGSVIYNVQSQNGTTRAPSGVNIGTAILLEDGTWFTQGGIYLYAKEIESWTEEP